MKEWKWPYLAALTDGEGTISIGSNWLKADNGETYRRHYLQMGIANTDRRLMQWLISNFGGRYYSWEPENRRQKTGYLWRPSGKKNQERFLLGILPYLVIKRRQAELALEYTRLTPSRTEMSRRDELERECRLLNQKGRSVSPTTNTPESANADVIESDLAGNCESAFVVTQSA